MSSASSRSVLRIKASCGAGLARRSHPSTSAAAASSAATTTTTTKTGRRGFSSLGVIGGCLSFFFVPAGARASTVSTSAGFFGKFLNPEFKQARDYVGLGMRKFLDGDVAGSVADFDEAISLDASYKGRLWQRGLSLYYTRDYSEAAEQFRVDVSLNPNDTEEALWTYLCEAQTVGPAKAREQFLVVGTDPRPLLRTVYKVYRRPTSQGEGQDDGPGEILEVASRSGSAHDDFYAKLYVSLWHESVGNADLAKKFMLEAVDTRYALQSGDYMCGLANVHLQQRGWSTAG